MFKRLTIAVMIILLTTSFTAFMAAGQDDSMEDHPWFFPPSDPDSFADRDLVVHERPSLAMISSYLEEEEFQFTFSVSSDQDLIVSAQFQGWSEEQPEMVAMEVWFLGLIEFRDADGDGVYNAGVDEAVSVHPLSNSFINSDLVEGENYYKDVIWDDDVFPDAYEPRGIDPMELYRQGFNAGWDLGFTVGEEDVMNDQTYDPNIRMRMGEDSLMGMIDMILEDLYDTYEETDQEIYLWMSDNIWVGLENGFQMGYDKAYDPDDGLDDTGTRSYPDEDPYQEEDPNGYREVPFPEDPEMDWSYPDYYYARYDPPDVQRVLNDDGSEKIMITVWDTDGIFGIRCTVSESFLHTDGGYLAPSEMKIDIMIRDYPFNATDTKLALLLDTGVNAISSSTDPTFEVKEVPSEVAAGSAFGEEQYRVSSSDFKGYFSWARNATCDGVDREVMASTESSMFGSWFDEMGRFSSDYRSVTFTYPQAETIDHDPKLGFIEVNGRSVLEPSGIIADVEDLLRGNVWIFIATTVVISAIVGLTWKRRGPTR